MSNIAVCDFLSKKGPSTVFIYGSVEGRLLECSGFLHIKDLSSQEAVEYVYGLENIYNLMEGDRLLLFSIIFYGDSKLRMEEVTYLLNKLGFTDETNAPVQCGNCGSTDFTEEYVYECDILSEVTSKCNNCKKTVGHCYHGEWGV